MKYIDRHLTVVTGILIAMVGAAVPALAQTPITVCGTTISTPGNYIVTADLNCPATKMDGIDIIASNVSVNLNGHMITGSGCNCPQAGINVFPFGAPRLNHVGITGPGLIQQFGTGIQIANSDYSQVQGVTSASNIGLGIGVFGDTYTTVGGNVSAGNMMSGLQVSQSTAVQVIGNQMVGNARGIWLQSGDSNSLTGNVASGNTSSGVSLGPGPLTNSRVSSNTTNGNGQAGIQVSPLIPPSFGNEIFSNTQSVGNKTFDLEDDNTVPPCGTDFWSGNVHFTTNQACVN